MKKTIALVAVLIAALSITATAAAKTHGSGTSSATIAITGQTDGTLLVTGSGYTPSSCQLLNEITDHGSIVWCQPTDSHGDISFTFGFVTSGRFTLNAVATSRRGYVVLASATWPGP